MMKFWKNPAHLRTLLGYLLLSAAVLGVCFSYGKDWLLLAVAAIVCLMFTFLRLIGDAVREARIDALNRKLAAVRDEGHKPIPPDGKRGALAELDGQVYRLTRKLYDTEEMLVRERREQEQLLRGMAQHLMVRAEELPANVHRRELIALAHDMEHLAALAEHDAWAEAYPPAKAEDIWQDALVMASETLRMQQITANVHVKGSAYVTTCARATVVGGLCGLLETCARHADVNSCWECTATENPVFTEFRISGDCFDWEAQQFAALFDDHADAEPALIYLSRLASLCDGEVRTERTEGHIYHLIFRLYKATR